MDNAVPVVHYGIARKVGPMSVVRGARRRFSCASSSRNTQLALFFLLGCLEGLGRAPHGIDGQHLEKKAAMDD